jgi:hypothetical protein
MTNTELEIFMDLFDTALASDTPAVKKALRNLMLVASIDTSTETHRPLRDLLRSYDSTFQVMNQEMRLLHSKIDSIQKYGPVGSPSTTTINSGVVGLGGLSSLGAIGSANPSYYASSNTASNNMSSTGIK